MSKRFKAKKRRSSKKMIFVVLFVVAFAVTFQTLAKLKVEISNEEFLRVLLSDSSPYMEKQTNTSFLDQALSFLGNLSFQRPSDLLRKNYLGLVDQKSASDGNKDVEELEETSDYIADPYPNQVIEKPKVYIYNTHQLEAYSTANIESYNVKPNVMMASYILREKLNQYGIPTMVEENNVTEFLKANNWNYASSYKVTRMMMEDAKEKNPTLEFFIDLHRDSVNKKISTAEINGKSYAKLLFIIGLENKNYSENLAVTEKIFHKLEEKYSGITRTIYKKEGKGVNGVYNQDFDKNTILVEMGGEENTIDEVLNSTEALAEVLKEYFAEGGIS